MNYFSSYLLDKQILASCLLSLIVLLAPQVQAADSLEVLYSDAFDGRSKQDQSIMTFVHSNNWRYGTNFYFVDLSNLGNFENAGNTYIEWGPRLSPGLLLNNKPLSFGIIDDIYLISEFDYLKNKFVEKLTILGGLSLALDLPGFRFFNMHVFNRNDPTITGHTQQMTFAWNFPFRLGQQNFSVGGFLDFVGGEGANASGYHGQPQLLWELNEQVHVGLEYLYWHNRAGRAGFNESALQAVFKVNF